MTKRTLGIILLAGIAILIVYILYSSVHAKPMAKMRLQLAAWSDGKSQMLASLQDADSVRAELISLSENTLGQSPELAEHRLRTLLSELCTAAGLSEYVISCKEPKMLGSPAANEKPKEFSQEQRRLADCIVQETTISGQGSYEACMRSVAMLEAQSWLARVSNISIQPVGKDRAAFAIVAGVTSLVLPDVATELTGENSFVHDPEASLLASSISRNPFVISAPEPVVAASERKPVEKSRPKPKPFGDWLVSGVMHTSSGGELILSNRRTGSSVSLRPGGQILGLTISAIENEFILLTEGESGYRVALGQSLAERELVIE
jgi:hypothetical protein